MSGPRTVCIVCSSIAMLVSVFEYLSIIYMRSLDTDYQLRSSVSQSLQVGWWRYEITSMNSSHNQKRDKQYPSDFFKPSLTSRAGNVTSRKGFLDQLVENKPPSDVKKRPVQGAIVKTDITSFKRLQPGKEIKTLNKETQKKLTLLEGLDLFSSGEIKLWRNEAWRRREKDLRSNYSKLSPIEEGRTEQSLPYH